MHKQLNVFIKNKKQIFATIGILEKIDYLNVLMFKIDRSYKMYDSPCWEKVNISQ